MKRDRGATGVGVLGREVLKSGGREEIELHLRKHGVRNTDLNDYFLALDNAIKRFHVNKGLAKKSSPAAVRKNLKRALARALKLNDGLNELDGNSRQILKNTFRGGVNALYASLAQVIAGLAVKSRAIVTP